MNSTRIALVNGTVADGSWIYPVAKELGVELVEGPAGTPEEASKLTQGCSAIMISLHRMTPAIIDAFAPTVKIIGRAGVGLDTIDVEYAKSRNIAVVNQPLYAIHEVSNHAVAMMLALHRGLFAANTWTREKGWGGATDMTKVHSIQDCTIGVIGCGRIGQSAISKLLPFAKKVVGFDPAAAVNLYGIEMVDTLDELLEQCQMITLHAPYLPSTHHMIGAAQIAKMPKGSIIVNVSRGGLIDEAALADGLTSGQISGAGLDVFQAEPLPSDSPLRNVPNLILSPHMAWYSESSGPRLIEWTIRDVFTYVNSNGINHGNFAAGPF